MRNRINWMQLRCSNQAAREGIRQYGPHRDIAILGCAGRDRHPIQGGLWRWLRVQLQHGGRRGGESWRARSGVKRS